MSLRVWLPLNGTLDNQGLDDIVVTNNGATVNNSGKIGKCYSFDGNSSGININGNIISTLAQGDFSICFWVYNDDQGNRSIYIATIPSSSYAFAIQKTTGEGLRVYWQSSPDYYPTNFTIPVQEWCHIVVVIKSNNCYCYKNGILTASREDGSFTPQKLTNTWLYGMLGRDLRTGATVLKGKMNDFRWYDHALSPLEVKEISKGLILHYPLNRNGWGQENLLKNSNDLTLWNKESGVNCEYDLTVKMYKVFSTTRESSRWGIYQDYSVSVDVDTEYTFSLTGKTDGFRSYLSFGAGSSWPTNYTAFDNNKQRLSKTLTIPAGTTNIRVYLAMYPTTGGGYTYFEKPKLEKGSKATPWCPNSSDALATTMGLNDNVEYDVSGYCNNGTRTGTFSWTSDTSKYNVSTNILNGSYIDTGYKENIGTGDFTVSVWIKMPQTSGKSYQPIFSNKTTGAASVGFAIYFNQNQNKLLWSTADGSAATEVWMANTINIYDKWMHIVMVRNASDAKKGYFYINGERYELASVPVIRNITNEIYNIQIGDIATHNNSAYRYVGLMSDFRIYATALSADDVKSLYQNSAYIDNQGNIYGAVYEEV